VDKRLFLFFLILLLLPVVVSAEVFKQNTQIDFTEIVTVDGAPSSQVTANITITAPDNLVLVAFQPMTFNATSNLFNFTLTSGKTGQLGTYERCVYASDGVGNKTLCFDFDVTPSGQNGLLGFYFLVIILSYGVVFLGVYKSDLTITTLGTFALFFVGLYILFFGLDIFKNFLTDGFAVITLGVAFYLSAKIGQEFIGG